VSARERVPDFVISREWRQRAGDGNATKTRRTQTLDV
jgi:hypothetical protein